MLQGFDAHTGLLLWVIAGFTDAARTSDPPRKVYSTEVYEKYSKICEIYGVEPLYRAYLSQCLGKLEKAEYISRRTVSLGRRGLQSEIDLLFDDPKIIIEAGNEVDWGAILR